MSENIRNTMKTLGWQEIEEMFRDRLVDMKKNIRTNGRRYEDVAIDTIALKEASRLVTKVLNDLNKIKNVKKMEKEKYI